MRSYIYLHGFASSPSSTKARSLKDQFQKQGLFLTIPDFNQPDFYRLTLSRQIQQVAALLPIDTPVTLIGSSFGGLTAAWVGERYPQVDRLVLLAPAFEFLSHWLPKLGAAQVEQWQKDDALLTYHYSEQRQMPISYQLVTDMAQYDESLLQRSIPTLILHGQQDDVIPIQSSRSYAASRPWVSLIELDSDHSLTNVQAEIWQAICRFCHLDCHRDRKITVF
jgi:uncharacterized protein